MASIDKVRDLLLNARGPTGLTSRHVWESKCICPAFKQDAIEAIAWLLSKTPHSTEEVADHFDLPIELVEKLIEEMTQNNLALQVSGCPVRYKAERWE